MRKISSVICRFKCLFLSDSYGNMIEKEGEAIFGKFNERSESKIVTSSQLDLGRFFFSYRCKLYCSWASLNSSWYVRDKNGSIKKNLYTLSVKLLWYGKNCLSSRWLSDRKKRNGKKKKFKRSFSSSLSQVSRSYFNGIKHLLWCISESLGYSRHNDICIEGPLRGA